MSATLMFLLLPAMAQAGEAEGPLSTAAITGSDDFEIRYWRIEGSLPDFPEYDHLFDYVEAVNRLNLVADAERWQVGVQADQVGVFGGKYYLDDVLQYEFDLLDEGVSSPLPMAYANLDKMWFLARGERGDVQIGDGYTAFGRGIALNLVKNSDIDIDTSIRGVNARLSAGSWDAVVVSGLTNPQQVLQDNPNRDIDGDRRNMVSGVRLARYGLGPANLGAHGVVYTFARQIDDPGEGLARYGEPVDASVVGADAEIFGLGGVDWYVEGDWFHYANEAVTGGQELTDGYALYGSAAFYPGRFVVLVEARHNLNTEYVNTFSLGQGYEVASGPTLEYERVITEDSSSAVNSNDVSGARVRVDLAAVPGSLTPYVSLSTMRDRDLGGGHFNRAPETIVHPVVGVDWQSGAVHVLFNGGFRTDIRDAGPDGEDLGADRQAHGDVSLGFPAGPVHGEVTADVQRFWWGNNTNQQHDFTISTVSAAAHMENGLSVILYTDYSDDPLVDSTGNLTDALYGAGELQYQPWDNTTFKAFYGAYRAGIRCAGGQCKVLPGFEGGRVSATVSF